MSSDPRRTEDIVRAELAEATAAKVVAINSGDFSTAAGHRDRERGLERELATFRDGKYRVSVTRPDGSHVTAESPSFLDAMEMCGFTDISGEIRTVLSAARVLDKACDGSKRVFA